MDPFTISIETIFAHEQRPATPSPAIPQSLVDKLGAVEWVIEKATHYRLPQPVFGERHYHSTSYQVVKVIEGKGELRIGGRRYPADCGGLYWVPPGVRHSSTEPEGQSSRLIEMFFHRNVPSPPPGALRRFPFHIACDDNPDVLICFHQIVKEFSLRKPFWEWTTSSLLNEMIVLLARSQERQATGKELTHVDGYRIDREAVTRAVNYIVQNYYHPVDLRSLAHEAGMSVNRFSKVFCAVEGTTPIDFLIEFRLKRASELIAEGRLSLTQIAEAVGFNSIHHFSNCYKQRLGVSPSAQHARGRR